MRHQYGTDQFNCVNKTGSGCVLLILNHGATPITIWMRLQIGNDYLQTRTRIRSGLVDALILRRRMEFEGRGVARQIYRDTVIGLNGKSASPETADAGDGDLFRRKRNIVVPRFLDNGLTNIFFCSCAVGGLHGFSLDGVFEFVVRKEGRDQLQAN